MRMIRTYSQADFSFDAMRKREKCNAIRKWCENAKKNWIASLFFSFKNRKKKSSIDRSFAFASRYRPCYVLNFSFLFLTLKQTWQKNDVNDFGRKRNLCKQDACCETKTWTMLWNDGAICVHLFRYHTCFFPGPVSSSAHMGHGQFASTTSTWTAKTLPFLTAWSVRRSSPSATWSTRSTTTTGERATCRQTQSATFARKAAGQPSASQDCAASGAEWRWVDAGLIYGTAMSCSYSVISNHKYRKSLQRRTLEKL